MKDSGRPSTVLSDEQIVELYWQRDERAIGETDQKYGRLLYTVAFNILHDRSDSEECRNDACLGVWNAIPPTRPAVFRAFIVQIMRRVSINRYKEKTSQKRIPSELTVSMEELTATLRSEETVEEEYSAIELGKQISDFVRGLSEREQYIFMSRYYFADPIESIAKALGKTESSVYKALTKIKKALKNYLEERGVLI